MSNFIFNISEEIDVRSGTKAMELRRLKELGIRVPRFWSINHEEYERFIEHFSVKPIDLFLMETNYDPSESEKIAQVKEFLLVSSEFEHVEKLIARSSSIPADDYDGYASMISGAFESYECDKFSLPSCIAAVYESLYSEKSFLQLKLAKLENGIKGMAVLIQEYIEPECSGVLHAFLDKSYMEVNWVKGHLRTIVAGDTSGDYDRIYSNEDGEVIIRGREQHIYCIMENNYCDAFTELYQTSKRILDNTKTNIEIEWLYRDNKVYVVQCQELINI